LEPYVNWQATDPVLQALAGQLSRSGAPGREPLLAPGSLTMNCATDQALFALLLAFFQRSRTGLGDRLDFSLVDGASQALDPGFGIGGSAAGGVRPGDMPPRQGGPQPYPIIRCADGFVRLCVLSVRQWQALYAWMGSPEEFSDPVFDTVAGRFTSPTWQPAIARFFSDKTREVLEAEGQRRGVAVAPLLNFDQAIASEHFAAREAFTTIKLAGSAEAPVPNGVFVIDGRRVPAAGAAPPELNPDGDGFRPRAVAPPSGHEHLSGRPLAGLRVLDLGVIVVGAEQGRLMAEYGAEVIKVESRAFPDGSRQQLEPGVKISLGFATGHRNKKSLGLNLRAPEGRDIFLNLARMSDVILSNFKPGTLDSLGLDAKTLLKANPKLVIADSSAYGSTGPWSGRMGYGPLVRAAAGLTAQWRYRERLSGPCRRPHRHRRRDRAVDPAPSHRSGRNGQHRPGRGDAGPHGTANRRARVGGGWRLDRRARARRALGRIRLPGARSMVRRHHPQQRRLEQPVPRHWAG
jgi:crotonobetainyl-CoA:carnitine CoA-transferase CaiB-like acyl-CoA transferase